MIIHKLEMYNFRQYIDLQEVSFSTDPERNVTVLIGVNTSGKTTIIRAFEWCLYGKNGFEDPVLLNSEVRDNMNVGDTQDVWVAVTFSHEDSNGQKMYPASAGHGLNLQSGGNILVWFGITWSLELYQQTVARLWRQGQTEGTVSVIHIVTDGTVDERILKALEAKDLTQSALIDAVKAEVGDGK